MAETKGAPVDDLWVEDASLPTLKDRFYKEELFGEEPVDGYEKWVQDSSGSTIEREYYKRGVLGTLFKKTIDYDKAIKRVFSSLDLEETNKVVFAAAGDSTTDWGFEYFEGGFRDLLIEYFPEKISGFYRWRKSTEDYYDYWNWSAGDGNSGEVLLYNGGYSGGRAEHQIERFDDMYPEKPDVFFICHGHNYKGEYSSVDYFLKDIQRLVDKVHSTFGDVPIVVVSQNPQFASSTVTAESAKEHMNRQLALKKYAMVKGWGYVPAMEAFLGLPDKGKSSVRIDGIHVDAGNNDKNNTTGGRIMMEAFKKWFRQQSPRMQDIYLRESKYPLINVKDFGTVGSGNSSQDDHAIASAIAYATGAFGQGGKTVVFPPVTYNTKLRIELKGNLKYSAYGATFTKTNTSSGYAVFYTKSSGNKGYGSGASNWSWEGGHFKGDFSTNNMICPFALHHSDNWEVSNFTCTEVQGIGHTFDLLGCSNFKIHDFKMYGFKNTSTGGYQRSECIQVDISAAGASSAPDDPGSYDGIMTINGEIYRGLFSSITSGGVFYPAPNPIGSHTQHEGRIPTGINFHHNVIVNPMQDTVSGLYGAIHFVGGDRINIDDNIFYYTEESPNFSTTLVAFYSTDKGVARAGADYEVGASNATVTLTPPLLVKNISLKRNKVWGVRTDSNRHLFIVTNRPEAVGTLYADNVEIGDNDVKVDSGTSALNAFNMTNVRRLYFSGRNSVVGPIRAIQSVGCVDVVIDDFYTESNRNDTINIAEFDGLRIKTMSSLTNTGTTLYTLNGTNMEVLGGFYNSLASSRAVALNGINIFQVSSIRTKSPSGVWGVQIYTSSTNGQVDGVIASGGATVAVRGSGATNVTITRELVVPDA